MVGLCRGTKVPNPISRAATPRARSSGEGPSQVTRRGTTLRGRKHGEDRHPARLTPPPFYPRVPVADLRHSASGTHQTAPDDLSQEGPEDQFPQLQGYISFSSLYMQRKLQERIMVLYSRVKAKAIRCLLLRDDCGAADTSWSISSE